MNKLEVDFCISFQICYSVSVVKRSTDSYKWSDVQIDMFRYELKQFPGMNPQDVDDFSIVLNNFRKNSTDHDIFEGIVRISKDFHV